MSIAIQEIFLESFFTRSPMYAFIVKQMTSTWRSKINAHYIIQRNLIRHIYNNEYTIKNAQRSLLVTAVSPNGAHQTSHEITARRKYNTLIYQDNMKANYVNRARENNAW